VLVYNLVLSCTFYHLTILSTGLATMLHFTTLFAAFFLSHLARSAPTTPLDANTLLQNAQAAQVLNTEFRTLKLTDACTSGQTGCISGALATCVNNAWTAEQCLTGQQCFALPSVREAGTFVTCTSAATAANIISATGADGGIFAPAAAASGSSSVTAPFPTLVGSQVAAAAEATATATDTATTTTTGSSTTTTTTTAAESSTTTADESGVTVTTVTVTIFASNGTTLSPAEATSLLSALSAERTETFTFPSTSSASSAVATPAPTETPGSSPPNVDSGDDSDDDSDDDSGEDSDDSSPTATITLESTSSTSPAVVGAIAPAPATIELTSTPLAAPAAATSAPALPYDDY